MKKLSMLMLLYLQLAILLTKGLAQTSPFAIPNIPLKKEKPAMDSLKETSTVEPLFKISIGGQIAQSKSKIFSNDFSMLEIIQDKEGFNWMSSMGILYRYKSNSLKGFLMAYGYRMHPEFLFMSRNGTIWFGRSYFRKGKNWATINQFNKKTEKFKTYYIPIEKAMKSFPKRNFKPGWPGDPALMDLPRELGLSEDDLGNLWIIMNIGIYQLYPKTGNFSYLPLPTTTFTDKQDPPYIRVFERGDNDQIWIGTNQGLYRYQAKKFTYFRHSPADSSSLNNNNIKELHIDSSKTLWIETDKGLNKFNPATGAFRRLSMKGLFPQITGWNHQTGRPILYQSALSGYEVDGEWRIDYPKPNSNSEKLERARQWLTLPLLILIIAGGAFFFYRIRQVRHEEQLKASFDKQLAEVSMTALRAQMNPHFLFNSLNSINHFIIKNKQEEAAEYLTKFSRLIRLILTNSKSPAIPLSNELEAIRLYIQLENIRFNNRFDYSIEIQEEVDVEYFEIPPLLIQPYVENAIWHGLLHKEGKGRLKLLVYVQDPFLYVVIEDDGVGRKKAQELKSKSATKDKSMGMQITSDRVEMLNKLKQQQATVEIIDLEDQQSNATGTKVILKVPL